MLKLHFFFLYSEDLVKLLYNNRKENFTGLLHLRSNWAVCVLPLNTGQVTGKPLRGNVMVRLHFSHIINKHIIRNWKMLPFKLNLLHASWPNSYFFNKKIDVDPTLTIHYLLTCTRWLGTCVEVVG